MTIILSDIVPLRERGTWQAVVNLIFAAGASMGAPLGTGLLPLFSAESENVYVWILTATNCSTGGVLADSIGWRWFELLRGLNDSN